MAPALLGLGLLLLAAGGKEPQDFKQGPRTFCDDSPSRTGFLPAGRGAQYFYWLADTRRNDSAPLILWMTGGPGCSSILAMLTENGPCLIEKGNASENWRMRRNPWSWTEAGTVLWVDQPGEVGFSVGAESDDELEVSERMLVFMLAFYERYPSLLKAPLFLAGESYAGHYVPAVATELLAAWDRGARLAKVRGLALGNALVSPAAQFASRPLMAFTGGKQEGGSVGGVVNQEVFASMEAGLPGCIDSILRCRRAPGTQISPSCVRAFHVCLTTELLPEMQCGRNVYDVRQVCHEQNVVDCFDFSAPQAFLNDAQVQKALGVPVGLAWRPCNLQVDSAFVRSGDYMSSTDGLVAELLERGVPVLAYSGDTDLMVDWLGTKGWMEKLAWRGQADWIAAPLRTFHVHNKSAGREKSYGGFTFLQVFESGHLVPKDQPEVALRMLQRFVSLHSDWAAAPPTALPSGSKDLGLRTQSPGPRTQVGPAFWAGLSALLGALCLAWALRLQKWEEPEGPYSLMT